MNKTISINLSGMLFNLEEAAYERLHRYLQQIRKSFEGTDGQDEIVGDIESRIAELFAERLKNKQVILEQEVIDVIAIMGEPETYKDEEEAPTSGSNPGNQNYDAYQSRRLFRDPDDAVLGGVCSGLGYYFGLDPVWLRLAFVIALFFAGSGPLLYIILWIVLPKANSTAEKLQMRGEQVNIENIERRIKEEAARFRERAEAFGEEARQGFKNANVHGRLGSFMEEFSAVFLGFFRRIILFMGRSFGVFLIFLGGVLLFAFLSTVFNSGNLISINDEDGISSFSVQAFFGTFFSSPDQQKLFLVGLSLVILAPIIGLLLGGLRLVLHPRLRMGWFGPVNGMLFLAGLVCCIVAGAMLVGEFSAKGRMIENVALSTPVGDTLELAVQPGSEINLRQAMHFDHWHFYYNDGESYLNGWIHVNVASTEETAFSISAEKSARGTDKKQAIQTAAAINYFYRQEGNTVYFNPYFTVKPDNKWRNQNLDVTLHIPEGKFIRFRKGTEDMLFNIQNVQNMNDYEMVEETWQMTKQGLHCVSCAQNPEENAETTTN